MKYEKITYKEYSKIKGRTGNYKVRSLIGTIRWVQDGKLHRLDGPAIIYSDEEKTWAINGIIRLKEEWFELLTPEQRAVALANPENF